MQKPSIAIVGATGLVGSTLLKLIEERNFPAEQLYLLASQQSVGKEIKWRNLTLPVTNLEDFDFNLTRYAFFCVSNDLSALYAPKAVDCGNIVIDKSYHFRRDPNVPLVIPEVNLKALQMINGSGIIANPNCNTIPIAVGLKPIYDAVGIARVNVCTYQSVSGTGKDAITELTEQSKQYLANQPLERKVYNQPIAFNVLPHIDDFQENGYTREEMKIVWEMQKIFADETMAINPTAVRVPVYCGHAASVHIETKDKITCKEATDLLQACKGIRIVTGKYPYATPLQDAAGNDHVYIGRIREDISHAKGLNLWIVADNLRKGAALNAIQIAEHLLTRMTT